MTYLKYIESNAEVLSGIPVLKGTRISVSFVLKRLSEGATYEDIIGAYPQLTLETILAVFDYASKAVSTKTILSDF